MIALLSALGVAAIAVAQGGVAGAQSVPVPSARDARAAAQCLERLAVSRPTAVRDVAARGAEALLENRTTTAQWRCMPRALRALPIPRAGDARRIAACFTRLATERAPEIATRLAPACSALAASVEEEPGSAGAMTGDSGETDSAAVRVRMLRERPHLARADEDVRDAVRARARDLASCSTHGAGRVLLRATIGLESADVTVIEPAPGPADPLVLCVQNALAGARLAATEWPRDPRSTSSAIVEIEIRDPRAPGPSRPTPIDPPR
jgi:hypothetical protein